MDEVCKAQGKATFPLTLRGHCQQQQCSMGMLAVPGYHTTQTK